MKGKEFSFSVGPKTVEPESFLKCINRGASKEGGTRLQVGLLTSALRLAELWGCLSSVGCGGAPPDSTHSMQEHLTPSSVSRRHRRPLGHGLPGQKTCLQENVELVPGREVWEPVR